MNKARIIQMIKRAAERQDEELNLIELEIDEVPYEIVKLKQLRRLRISNNPLHAIPPHIADLPKLEILSLENNELISLPKEIGKLGNLKGLTVSHNRISFLPNEIGLLSNLQALDISNNQIALLPSAIGKLGSLEGIEASNNKITKLPHAICLLANLRILVLGNNQLEFIPTEIGLLQNLEELILGDPLIGLIQPNVIYLPEDSRLLRSMDYLPPVSSPGQSNNVRDLPREILELKKLRNLELRGNPINIPPEILEKPDQPSVILNYFFQVRKDRRHQLLEAKVLFVGQGSVGKTSLVQQILHNTFDQNQNKTEGIAITQWTVSEDRQKLTENSTPSGIKLNIWDFGGQEIMHATHQFFLTKRSLYILVLDARLTQEENRVEYWLKIIQSFGGESPVLVVGNKTDQHPLDIDRTGLQKKYPNLVGVVETSAATGRGIGSLKAEIAKQVDSLPHVRDLLPEAWFTVKSLLEKLGKDKNFITQDEYLSLCKTNNIMDETSQHTLIGFLHDLGVILHFQDDPRLEALGILNPQWVTVAAYKILGSRLLFMNQGRLTLAMLNSILDQPDYPRDKRIFIVDMMKKFELCYDIEPDKSFLIPDLLPKDEPFTGEWDGALAFQYHYNVLPSSVISRFIVRMNAFIHKTVWRSGVVLQSGGNKALVKADIEDRKIYIRIHGNENTRRDFLSAIRIEFETIHKTIVKIEAVEKVPLPNYPNSEPVDYRLLLQLEQKGITTYHVQAASELVEVNVVELLDGVRTPKNQAAKIFISYAHKDKMFVKKLASELETAGLKVWWDFDSLKAGQDWQKEIERGIKKCDFFLVTLTPDAVKSEWVGNEITYANQAQKRIIPLHLKKCNIPIGLIKKQFIDFEKQTQKAGIEDLLKIIGSDS